MILIILGVRMLKEAFESSKEEYIESLNKANDVDFNSYISILMNGRSCL